MNESKTPENNPMPSFIAPTDEEVSVLHPTTFQVGHSSNEIVLVLSDQLPVFDGSGDNALTGQSRTVAVGVIKMSPQTAKDLFLVMRTSIQQYERQFGPIKTAYSLSMGEVGE